MTGEPPVPPLVDGEPPLAILIDYDGTISLTDVTDQVMARARPAVWEEGPRRCTPRVRWGRAG